MAFVKPIINKISTDIKDLTIYIRTIKKFGKSTLFRDVIIEKYGDPEKGLLVSIGKENGDKLLDNVNVTHVNTWKDLVELKEWLLKEKGKEHNIEIVAFDTTDEFFPILEKEVVRLDNIENPTKKAKTIKAAFGGYNAGVELAMNMAKDYFGGINDAGFGVWAIGHTKYKNIKQKGDLTDGYMNLSSTLNSNYESVFGDIFDVTLTGYIDRDLEEEKQEVNGKEKITRYATDSIRKLYFRGTSLIDAGGRFADGAVPEYLIFDEPNMGKKFVETVKKGMEASKSTLGKTNKANKPIKPKKEIVEEVVEDNVADDEAVDTTAQTDVNVKEDTIDVLSLVDEIRKKFKLCADKGLKAEIKTILADNGGKLSEDIDVSVLKDLLQKLS